MSNKISRRTFLKCTGASAAALGTAALLGGCQSSSNASVEVKVGDKVSNWNNLGVQLTSVFTLTSAPDVPGHEYVAVLVTAVNRSSSVTFNIGAPNIAEINAAYPLDTDAAKAANTAPYFHALSASTTDFAVSATVPTWRAALTSPCTTAPPRPLPMPPACPRSAPATLSWSAWCPPAGSRSRSPIPRPLSPTRRSLSA